MLNQKLLGSKSVVPVDPAWDISYAQFNGEPINYFSVAAQQITLRSVFFKPDGTKFYTADSNNGAVKEYTLSTEWDISTASFAQNFSVSAQESSPQSVFFKPDGTKMYVTGSSGDDVNEYSLSTAWDISTASFIQNSSVASQDTLPTGLFFKPDGTKMYVTGTNLSDAVFEYDLSTAWDISTKSYITSFSLPGQNPQCVFFRSDGLKMYVSDIDVFSRNVKEYNLSTAWDISSAAFLQNFNVAAQDTNANGLFFKDDGTVMYIAGDTSDTVYQYQLASAWDISTATFTFPDERFSVAAQDTNPKDLVFKPDGTKMYFLGGGGVRVNEYSISTAWDISTASYVRAFSVSAQESSPYGLFFKPDGTKMYIVGLSGDDVNEYNLSIAWNISTATYVQNFSVATEDLNPYSLFFRSDGIKMYITGGSGRDVNEYTLSTAWDISTASYVQNFSVSAQENQPQDVFFKTDGTKMYIIGNSSDRIHEYSLSTAWDISTATYVQNFSVAIQDSDPQSLFFRDDGTKMFILGNSSDAVWAYDLQS